jgi:Bacteriophage probable baseplate hub protein
MATIVNLRELSTIQDGFYVPGFEVKVDGVGLPGNVVRDVLQLTYKDNIKEIDGFEMTVNNWDPGSNRFKYLGSEGEPSSIFDPSDKEVTVSMGYAGHLRVMLTGYITTMEPNFPASGPPTLTVRGLNVLHQLRKKQYTWAWTEKRDSEIAKNIETLMDGNKKRFPIPIKVDPDYRNNEPELDYVSQDNQYDIDFLLSRARQRGYVLLIEEQDKKVTGSEKQLFFGPSDKKNKTTVLDEVVELEWGFSLIDFKPTLTTANQIRSVTVRGWDRRTKKVIEEKASLDDAELKVNRDLQDLLKKINAREEQVVDEPVFTRKQAHNRAVALLKDRHKEMVKANGSTIGLPDLRAGKKIVIKGFGPRFSGTYFLTETTHTIDNSGYITRFQARREETK